MEFTLNDFEYHFKFGQKLRRISCKHCLKTIKFTIPKHGTIHDVQIHSEHECVAHALATIPVDNVGTFFSRFAAKEQSISDNMRKSRLTPLKSSITKLSIHLKRLF